MSGEEKREDKEFDRRIQRNLLRFFGSSGGNTSRRHLPQAIHVPTPTREQLEERRREEQRVREERTRATNERDREALRTTRDRVNALTTENEALRSHLNTLTAENEVFRSNASAPTAEPEPDFQRLETEAEELRFSLNKVSQEQTQTLENIGLLRLQLKSAQKKSLELETKLEETKRELGLNEIKKISAEAGFEALKKQVQQLEYDKRLCLFNYTESTVKLTARITSLEKELDSSKQDSVLAEEQDGGESKSGESQSVNNVEQRYNTLNSAFESYKTKSEQTKRLAVDAIKKLKSELEQNRAAAASAFDVKERQYREVVENLKGELLNKEAVFQSRKSRLESQKSRLESELEKLRSGASKTSSENSEEVKLSRIRIEVLQRQIISIKSQYKEKLQTSQRQVKALKAKFVELNMSDKERDAFTSDYRQETKEFRDLQGNLRDVINQLERALAQREQQLGEQRRQITQREQRLRQMIQKSSDDKLKCDKEKEQQRIELEEECNKFYKRKWVNLNTHIRELEQLLAQRERELAQFMSDTNKSDPPVSATVAAAATGMAAASATAAAAAGVATTDTYEKGLEYFQASVDSIFEWWTINFGFNLNDLNSKTKQRVIAEMINGFALMGESVEVDYRTMNEKTFPKDLQAARMYYLKTVASWLERASNYFKLETVTVRPRIDENQALREVTRLMNLFVSKGILSHEFLMKRTGPTKERGWDLSKYTTPLIF